LYSSGFEGPGSILPDKGVGVDKQPARDGGNGQLGWLAALYQRLIGALEVRIESGGDERGHIECLPKVRALTLNEALALPLA